ncbi:MAG: hypothetical protein JSR24_09130 [Proteobacteria bacterium]|nr:hypothetical protein [Pseudomonadota bacterium]
MLNPPGSRIEWFARIFITGYLATIGAVMGGVFLAHAFDFNLGAPSSSIGQPYSCNLRVGARVLFYGLWIVELATMAGAIRLARNKEDVARFNRTATRAVFPKHDPNSVYPYTGLAIRFVLLGLIAYWGSYHFAYVDQGICAHKWLFQSVLDGCYIIALNFCRGLCLMMGYIFYFAFRAPSDVSTSSENRL